MAVWSRISAPKVYLISSKNKSICSNYTASRPAITKTLQSSRFYRKALNLRRCFVSSALVRNMTPNAWKRVHWGRCLLLSHPRVALVNHAQSLNTLSRVTLLHHYSPIRRFVERTLKSYHSLWSCILNWPRNAWSLIY